MVVAAVLGVVGKVLGLARGHRCSSDTTKVEAVVVLIVVVVPMGEL